MEFLLHLREIELTHSLDNRIPLKHYFRGNVVISILGFSLKYIVMGILRCALGLSICVCFTKTFECLCKCFEGNLKQISTSLFSMFQPYGCILPVLWDQSNIVLLLMLSRSSFMCRSMKARLPYPTHTHISTAAI